MDQSIGLHLVIASINQQFIQESRSSPALLADMAALEKYMAESYSGRIFIELLQNADDCGSKKILVKQIDGDLYFANDGRPFNEHDVMAICRSGASFKKRGTSIGYRGVGFKSTTYLSDEIIVKSDDTCFTFSKSIGAQQLGVSIECIPTVRIPFIVDSLPLNQKSNVDAIISEGYSTVFIFQRANMVTLWAELDAIENDYFVFLKNIAECRIVTKNVQKCFAVKRQSCYDFVDVVIQEKTCSHWRIYQEGETAVCFAVNSDNEVCECRLDEAIYHCYLPTLDKSLMKVKINASFSTDPSRKHITSDLATQTILKRIAQQITGLIKKAFSSSGLCGGAQLLTILSNHISFSSINLSLKRELESNIKGIILPLANGTEVTLSEYRLFPNWLEPTEIDYIRKNCLYIRNLSFPRYAYENNSGIDAFISHYSDAEFGVNDFVNILADGDFCTNLNATTHGKMLSYVVKQNAISQKVHGKSVNIGNIFAVTMAIADDRRTNDQTKNVGTTSRIFRDKNLEQEMRKSLSKSDAVWLQSATGIKLTDDAIEPRNEFFISPVKSAVPIVTKWRSAEQQVIQIEECLGNKANDVSKQNIGYDVESTTPDGSVRRIEVKSLQSENAGFSITNNEYSAAHQYGDEYYICLMFTEKAIYIQNPLAKLSFEKRVRQWEWICETYCGTAIEFRTK